MTKVYIVQYQEYDGYDFHRHVNHGVYEDEKDAQEAVKVLQDNKKSAYYKEHEVHKTVEKYNIKEFQIALYIPDLEDGDDSNTDLDEYYKVKELDYVSLTPPKQRFIGDLPWGDDIYYEYGHLDDFIKIEVDSKNEELVSKIQALIFEIAFMYSNLIDHEEGYVDNEKMDGLVKKLNTILDDWSFNNEN